MKSTAESCCEGGGLFLQNLEMHAIYVTGVRFLLETRCE
jgi:hypothetical protein